MVMPVPPGHRQNDDDFSSRIVAEETWRIFRIMAEFVVSIEVMAHVGPAVSEAGLAAAQGNLVGRTDLGESFEFFFWELANSKNHFGNRILFEDVL